MYLFQETIESWEDWSRVFQSAPAFEPLVREIFHREGLPFSRLRNMTPGTNAVFRVEDLVVKVFFPKESGLDPTQDFENESAVCQRLTELKLPIPRLLSRGEIEDKYRFYYLIEEFAQGVEAGNWLPAAQPAEKRALVNRLKIILPQINRPAAGLIAPVDLRERALNNPRLKKLPFQLEQELKTRARMADLTQPVLVHGDLTGENLLVDKNGKLTILDWADACLAPFWYEYGPLVFELFKCDPILLKEFAGKNPETFAEDTLNALSIHAFGPELLLECAKRENRPPFSSLEEVREYLIDKLR